MTWILVIVGFSALIILHEFGHFAIAKATGMRVERFFLFFPPKLVSVKRGETEYGIGMIPLGGFVKITGMNPEELEPDAVPEGEDPDAGRDTPQGLLSRVEASGQEPSEREALPPDVLKRAYYNQPVSKRVAVIAAGPAMNILIAFVILFFLAFSVQQITGPGLKIAEVTQDSAAKGQLEPGDKVVSIDGQALSNENGGDRADRFRELIGSHKCAGQQTDGCQAASPVSVVVDRGGQQVPLQISPRYDPSARQVLLGVRFEPTDTGPVATSVPDAAGYAVDTMWLVTSKTVSAIARIFLPEQRQQLSGPVGSSRALNEAIGFSTQEAFFVLAVISLSLGVINLFPFLPLDGGHIFWSLVEKIRGARVPFSVIERASAVGFLLILLLFVVGLSNDLGRLGDSALNPR
ncbi:MAG TPA: M50 family metallopeptidase [Solirubrobacterales bacterium]|nr:M50 family metallopeptidase [Solirubrobacterales bacterium]